MTQKREEPFYVLYREDTPITSRFFTTGHGYDYAMNENNFIRLFDCLLALVMLFL